MNRNMPLSRKLVWLVGVVMVPLIILVIYLIVSLVNLGTAYNKIVKNISIASGYNFRFREQLDYTMYRITINEKTYEDLIHAEKGTLMDFEGDRLVDPYQTINRAKTDFKALMEEADSRGNKGSADRLNWMLKSMDRLEETIKNIEGNVKNHVPYSENEKLYNNAGLILTEMIQEEIQKYIQDEAEQMELIRVSMEESQNRAVTVSIYALVLIFAVSLLVARRITLSVTRPIKTLCEATEQVAKGDFTSQTQIDAGDEIQTLTTSFNHMKIQIGRLIEDVKTEKDNLRATELKLLQAQINPHFLYNTLDAIIWLAESGKNDQVVDMVTSLSEFFRTVLSKGKDFITVQEEVSHIQSYLSIQQFRYQDIMEYEIDVDRELSGYPMLKLTLQPIVENALYHGIKNKRGKGKITVRGWKTEDTICFSVEDNGIGLTAEQLESLRRAVQSHRKGKDDGFGLANVDERIGMAYGSRYGLSFESVYGEGTAVTVTLPAALDYPDKKQI